MGDNDTISYTYDELGRPTTLAAQGGRSLNYVYDALNRLNKIRDGAEEYAYSYLTARSPLVSALARPNGSVTGYSYNLLGQLTAIHNKDAAGAIISGHDFTYNQQDLRGSEAISGLLSSPAPAEGLVEYDYNNLNQLLEKIDPAQAFAYDANGNMTMGYTPEGYVFSASYDAENRLSGIEYTDGAANLRRIEYRYRADSFLAEIRKYENTALIDATRIVRGPYLALQDRAADNGVTGDYLWGLNFGGGIGGLLNLRQNGQGYDYMYDGIGNVTALLDPNQQVVASYRYDTFGKLVAKSGAVEQPFQFSTKRYEAGVGLNYYGYRFYAPDLGRWMNRDPLGEAGGINLYGFVQNDPVNWVDPEGTSIIPLPHPSFWVPPLIIIAYPVIVDGIKFLIEEWHSDEPLDEFCREQIEGCSEMCKDAMCDPDRQNVYGGSMSSCMQACVPEICGGAPKWKGYFGH